MALGFKDMNLTLNFLKDMGEQGANSKVYRVHDPQLHTELVVKRIPKSDFKDEDQYFSEARLLYHNSHPNIVQVQYVCVDEEFIYIAMPCYSSGSINALINNRFLKVREVIKYSLQFLLGLNFIHSKGLIHFDIKPSNILIGGNNEAALSDFGLSEYIDERGFANQSYFYEHHVTPEKIQTNEFTIQHDIYQVGLTLYRMLNGNAIWINQLNKYTLPSNGFDEAAFQNDVLQQKFPDRKIYLPHIPKKLKNVVNKCLKVDLTERYSSVVEIMNDLSLIEGTLDWIYTFENKIHSWEHSTNDKTITVIMQPSGKMDFYDMAANKKTAKVTQKIKSVSQSVPISHLFSKEFSKQLLEELL